ncbi:SusF/SusE family outer membrane protein [Botryobacter ruber]|uniref:SusF/SusE family outer membrane protein n=1 Tax=Botryobacter ruber TaxID=2171629 RepID=UPI000E0C61C9|nr:SusF/SusE family outer membrane protein [Botryobacter ruber]
MKNNVLNSSIVMGLLRKSISSGSVLLLLFASLFLASCDPEEEAVMPVKASTPVLSASSDALVLNQKNINKAGLTFEWTPGTNRGTNTAIDYTLQLDKKGNNFATPVEYKLGRAVYSNSLSVGALHELLTTRFGVAPGTAGELEARLVSAPATTALAPEFSNTVTVSITPYIPVTPTLYLLGSATPNGWNTGNATPLTVSSTDPTVFTYTGPLSVGEFKFITTLGQFLPSYNKGTAANQLVLRTDDSQPDEKFSITKAATYKVTVNLADLSVAIAEQAGPPYSRLWVVGDAAPTGWDLDNAAEMTKSASDPFVFTFTDYLKAGELKIATAKDWGAPFYRPTVADAPTTSTAVQVSAGDPDYKWKIAQAGVYKVTLNLRTMTIAFAPVELYLVGDAGPNGWNIESPAPMSKSGSVYTYTGPLTPGELKISMFKGDWCGGDWINAATANQAITNGSYITTSGCEGPDNKWRVTDATAGNYTVSVDLAAKTMTIVRQ